VKVLTLDRLVHGFVDLDDPTWFGYDYEAIYSGVVAGAWPKGASRERPVRALFLGGGPYGFQRRLRALHGDSLDSVTAEIDPAVTRAGREALGLEDDVTHAVDEDARTYVRRLQDRDPPFHLVFGDTFNDLSVPWHLTTLEFTQELKRHMTPDGVYLVNLVDSFRSGRFVGAFLRTLERVFRRVHLFSATPRRDDAQETLVLIASDADLDLSRLGDVVVYGTVDLAALRARAGPALLTDDHAPVESLLAPVVTERDIR
jgi:spermidine synthase